MTPEQALELLGQATQPQLAGQITRQGYAQIEQALAVLGAVVKERAEAEARQAGAKVSEAGP